MCDMTTTTPADDNGSTRSWPLFLASFAWIGGELHYGNCLQKAEVEGKTVAHCSRWP